MLTNEQKFKRGNDHDGVLLWQFLINYVNPLVCMSVGNLKDKLEFENWMTLGKKSRPSMDGSPTNIPNH
eukprot:14021523-Ditylum_brightwellii.AAC.1